MPAPLYKLKINNNEPWNVKLNGDRINRAYINGNLVYIAEVNFGIYMGNNVSSFRYRYDNGSWTNMTWDLENDYGAGTTVSWEITGPTNYRDNYGSWVNYSNTQVRRSYTQHTYSGGSGSFVLDVRNHQNPTISQTHSTSTGYEYDTRYYNVYFSKGTGVSSFTVNGTRYTGSISLKFTYNQSISVTATASSGYNITGGTGTFYASSSLTTISLTAAVASKRYPTSNTVELNGYGYWDDEGEADETHDYIEITNRSSDFKITKITAKRAGSTGDPGLLYGAMYGTTYRMNLTTSETSVTPNISCDIIAYNFRSEYTGGLGSKITLYVEYTGTATFTVRHNV